MKALYDNIKCVYEVQQTPMKSIQNDLGALQARSMSTKVENDGIATRTDSLSQVMRSFLSFSFFKPAKAIFVPGMYCKRNE